MESEDEKLARQLQAEEYRGMQRLEADAPLDILVNPSPAPAYPSQPSFHPVQLDQPYPPAYPAVNVQAYPPPSASNQAYLPPPAGSQAYPEPQSYYPQGDPQPGPQIIIVLDQNQNAALEQASADPKTLTVLKQARLIRWLAVIEALICILLIVSGLFFLIFLIVMPVCGYFAGRRLSVKLAVVFLIYLGIVLIIRIIITALIDSIYFTVIEVISMAIDIVFMWFTVRFIRLLRTLSPDQIAAILVLQNGVPRRMNNE